VNFEIMNKIKNWFSNWRRQFKFAIYDPTSFNELFGFTTSKISIVSFLALLILVISFLFILLLSWTPLGNYFFASAHSPEQTEIVEQRMKLDSLSKKVEAQEMYINNTKRLLFGDFENDTIGREKKSVQINTNSINPTPSKAEETIGEEVKSDQYTNTQQSNSKEIVHFISPVKGMVSQSFKELTHEALDIVTPPNTYFSTCLSGTVIYSGYSQKDGNILIVEHPNGFLSIYKHAKTNLKKRGDKVRIGDIIGIVGNTGTNTTGAHLHFELWLNQQAVDPEKYMSFKP
jgi:murein DD-endopeptidase MepM/ murein hydrolase activator NlpD